MSNQFVDIRTALFRHLRYNCKSPRGDIANNCYICTKKPPPSRAATRGRTYLLCSYFVLTACSAPCDMMLSCLILYAANPFSFITAKFCYTSWETHKYDHGITGAIPREHLYSRHLYPCLKSRKHLYKMQNMWYHNYSIEPVGTNRVIPPWKYATKGTGYGRKKRRLNSADLRQP